jgi:hypothetical protein
METYKEIIHIDNNRFIFNVNWSKAEWTWYFVERRNEEEVHLPLAFTFSRIAGCPVFRIVIFKLMLELAIK